MHTAAHLQRRAHDDKQVSLWEVFDMLEVALGKILPKKHYIRFDRPLAECTQRDPVSHYEFL